MRDVDVLMLAGCTFKEAEETINNGTIVFSDFEKNFEKYMKEWCIDEDEQEEYKEMIRTGKPVIDWEVVKTDDKTYYVRFCL